MPYNVQDRYDTQGSRMRAINPDPAGTVTIRNPRNGQSVSGVVASLGRTETQEMIPGVAITQIRYQDFIIDAADLDFGSGPVRPEYGWEIDRVNGETYKIIAPGGEEEAPFQYITATKKRMRIHAEYLRKTG